MMTSRPARTMCARVRVLLCLASVILLACLPVFHHHPAPTKAAPVGQSDQSCTLCAVFAGISVDGVVPDVDIPPCPTLLSTMSVDTPISHAGATCADGRAPPLPTV